MANATSENRLNMPGRRRSVIPRVRVDRDAFGKFAESFARFMGTAQFLFWMTVIIVAWLLWNGLGRHPFDEYPFIFLTLVLSLQASYAAPLILLAQNRQEARDRVALEQDRARTAQSTSDMDFLAREIASLRMSVGELASREFVRNELRTLLAELADEESDEETERRTDRTEPTARAERARPGRDA